MSKQQGHVDLAGKDLEFERMQADLRRAQALLEDEIKCAKLIFCICRDITSRKKPRKSARRSSSGCRNRWRKSGR